MGSTSRPVPVDVAPKEARNGIDAQVAINPVRRGWFFVPTDGYTAYDWLLEITLLTAQSISVIVGFILYGIWSVYVVIATRIGMRQKPSPTKFKTHTTGDGSEQSPHQVIIIGTGFSGLGLAIQLRRQGLDDFVCLEREKNIGGTWWVNKYPGCACDVPSNLYSYSFEPNPEWTQLFSPQPEIRDYLLSLKQKYYINNNTKFDFDVEGAEWLDEQNIWKVKSKKGGVVYGRNLVAGFGGLSDPSYPKVPGRESFKGVNLHTAKWDDSVDLTNKRIAVIGTGASAVQAIPELAPIAKHLTVFQRTPAWVAARYDLAVPEWAKKLFHRFPVLQYFVRGCLYFGRESYVLALGQHRAPLLWVAQSQAKRIIERQVGPNKPELIEKITPKYTLGCKRVLLHNSYYSSLARDDVTVVTSGVKEIKPHSIISADGKETPIDVIVYATGFQVHRNEEGNGPNIIGRNGIKLMDRWKNRMSAHLSMTVPGFPNLFFMLGPNSGLAHNSIIVMIEGQIDYILDALHLQEHQRVVAMEPKEEAFKKWLNFVDSRFPGSVWHSGGCKSWYTDSKGQNSSLYPTWTWMFRLMTERVQPNEYTFRAQPGKSL